MFTVNDLRIFFEREYSPIQRQSSWDNSGAQIYLGDKELSGIALALDPTQASLDQAIDLGCNVLLTHHPLIFKPLKSINKDTAVGSILIKAIQNEISILSYHTNLDLCLYNTSRYALELLGCNYSTPLSVEGEEKLYKVIVYTPLSYADKVMQAVFDSGGGKYGTYDSCSFLTQGTGTFRPLEGSNPFLGNHNEIELVDEFRQEFLVAESSLSIALSSITKAHPYELPAIDILELKVGEKYGFGAIGDLNKNYNIKEFLELIKQSLQLKGIRLNYYPDFNFSKICVVGGSGASMWRDCISSGVKILVTGDMKHHDAIDAKAHGICIIDIGHYESEHIFMKHLSSLLKGKFSEKVFLLKEDIPILNY